MVCPEQSLAGQHVQCLVLLIGQVTSQIESCCSYCGLLEPFQNCHARVLVCDGVGRLPLGLVDEQDAMKQMIFRTLQTERYQYIIYPWYYGIETLDLYGEPVTWVCPELERRISEALAVDERITGVTDFEFDLTVKGVGHAYFTVKTIYGDIKAEKGVKI